MCVNCSSYLWWISLDIIKDELIFCITQDKSVIHGVKLVVLPWINRLNHWIFNWYKLMDNPDALLYMLSPKVLRSRCMLSIWFVIILCEIHIIQKSISRWSSLFRIHCLLWTVGDHLLAGKTKGLFIWQDNTSSRNLFILPLFVFEIILQLCVLCCDTIGRNIQRTIMCDHDVGNWFDECDNNISLWRLRYPVAITQFYSTRKPYYVAIIADSGVYFHSNNAGFGMGKLIAKSGVHFYTVYLIMSPGYPVSTH